MKHTTSAVPAVSFWRRRLSRMQTATGLAVSILFIVAAASTVYYVKWRANPFLSGIPAGPTDSRRASPMPFGVGADVFSLIPKNEIYAGGPPKDGIPALTNPRTVSAISSGLQPADRVIGVVIGGEPRAYPLRILNWHEIANDTLGGRDIAVTYCPLCDSAVVFDRRVDGEVREFGVSGLLYNSNVLMYDRQGDESAESLWSQMMLKAVVGPAAERGLKLEVLPAQLTTWSAWVARHPQTTSLSFQTGHRRDYGNNPYESYFTSNEMMFPVRPMGKSPNDYDSLPGKEPLLIVSFDGRLKGYPVSRLREALDADASTVADTFAGRTLVFGAVDEARTTFEVYDGDGKPVPIAFSFWFKFRTAHPDAEVF